MHVRVYENLRTVSYAPFYVAEALGLHARHGLEVEEVPSPTPEETARGLLEGRVDVSWGGPMRVMLAHDRDPQCPLVCFCQVVARDPFMLIGRRPRPGFRLAELHGLRLAVVSEVPTPWMLLCDDLQRADIDPGSLALAPPRSMAGNVEALAAGAVDVIQVMEPHAQQAIEQAGGHIWYAASLRGPLAFTSFYTRRDYLDARPQVCAALTASLMDAVAETYARNATELAEMIGERFADRPAASLAASLRRYQRARLWSRDAALPPAHVVRLKAALLAGGLIARDIPCAEFIDDRFAMPGGPAS